MLTFVWMEVGELFVSRRIDSLTSPDTGMREMTLPIRGGSGVEPFSSSSSSLDANDADIVVCRLMLDRTAEDTDRPDTVARVLVPLHLLRLTGGNESSVYLRPGGLDLVPVPNIEPLVRGCGVPIPFPAHWRGPDLVRLIDRLRGRLRTLCPVTAMDRRRRVGEEVKKKMRM